MAQEPEIPIPAGSTRVTHQVYITCTACGFPQGITLTEHQHLVSEQGVVPIIIKGSLQQPIPFEWKLLCRKPGCKSDQLRIDQIKRAPPGDYI